MKKIKIAKGRLIQAKGGYLMYADRDPGYIKYMEARMKKQRLGKHIAHLHKLRDYWPDREERIQKFKKSKDFRDLPFSEWRTVSEDGTGWWMDSLEQIGYDLRSYAIVAKDTDFARKALRFLIAGGKKNNNWHAYHCAIDLSTKLLDGERTLEFAAEIAKLHRLCAREHQKFADNASSMGLERKTEDQLKFVDEYKDEAKNIERCLSEGRLPDEFKASFYLVN